MGPVSSLTTFGVRQMLVYLCIYVKMLGIVFVLFFCAFSLNFGAFLF